MQGAPTSVGAFFFALSEKQVAVSLCKVRKQRAFNGVDLWRPFAFCRKMGCILPQNGRRFAAKWIAFCRKMENVLPQNGLRFAAKWK